MTPSQSRSERRPGGRAWPALLVALGLLVPAAVEAEPGVTDTEIVIGCTSALSGPLAFIGTELTRVGVDLYVKALNDTGGIHGRKVRTVCYDDAYDPQAAAANTRRLVEEDGVFAIIAPQGHRSVAAIVDYLEARRVPLLFPYQGSPPARGRKYVFGGTMPSDRQARLTVDYLVGQRKYRRFALLHGADDYGTSFRAFLVRALDRHGLGLVASEAVRTDPGATAAAVARLRKVRPEVTVLALVPTAAAYALRERQQASWNDTLMVAAGPLADDRMLSFIPDVAEGLEGLALWPHPGASDLPGVRRYREHLHRYFPKHEPTRYSLAGYFAAMLLAEGVRRAGRDLTRDGFVAALESLRDFESGILPPLTIGPDHEVQKHAVWVRLEKGSFRALTELLTTE